MDGARMRWTWVAVAAACILPVAVRGQTGGDPCDGVACGPGEECQVDYSGAAPSGVCECLPGYERDPDSGACDLAWETTWLACPLWFDYASTAHCVDEDSCDREVTEQEGWDICLDFLDHESPCHYDPNAVRLLNETCFGLGMQEGAECTPWPGGAAPCAEGLRCVSTWNNTDATHNPPVCYPNDMMFTQAHYGGACAHDYECAAGYYCETQGEYPFCQRYEAEYVCTQADAEALMSRHEDDQTVPEISYGCMGCMAAVEATGESLDACMPHGFGNHQPVCNFGRLMEILSDAINRDDIVALLDDTAYHDCTYVADTIRDVQLADSCP